MRLAETMLASGQTQKAWCEEHGVKLDTMRDWVRLRRRANEGRLEKVSSGKWLEVNSPVSETEPSSEIAIRIGACSVHVVPGFDRETLVVVCETLLRLC